MTNQTVELTTEMIQNGEHQELYEEYAKKKARGYMDNHIKCALAGYGYCHDILCDDPVTSVREHVISSDIHYAPICFDGTRVLWEHIANELVENEQPKTPDILPIYEWFLHLDLEQLNINLSAFNKVQYEAIKLIHQAETTVPTTIEKTMTPSQLYTRDLLNKVKPKPKLVRTLLDALPPTIPNTHGSMEVKALELKVQEPEQPMTAIECTMDVQQLYSVQSEHWYRTLTGRQVSNILYAECQLQDKELVVAEFDHLYDSGDILSISTKVEKLQRERRIGLPSQKQKGEG